MHGRELQAAERVQCQSTAGLHNITDLLPLMPVCTDLCSCAPAPSSTAESWCSTSRRQVPVLPTNTPGLLSVAHHSCAAWHL